MRLHVATVGSGRDVEHSVLFSIRESPVDCVLLLATSKTRPTAEKIAQTLEAESIPFTIEICDEISDVNVIARCYRRAILEAMKQYSAGPADVAVDFTRGTKAMSAALVYVSVELGLGTMMYVNGQRDKCEQIITGTEKLVKFKPADLLFERDFQILVRFFNTYRFSQGREVIKEIRARYVNPLHKERMELLDLLFEAYDAWDRFDLKRAGEIFQVLGRELKLANGRFETLKKKFVDDQGRIIQTLKENPWDREWCLAFFMAAERRHEEGRVDVAVALLYRLIEFLAHRRLKEMGYDPAGIPLERLPDSIHLAWEPYAENGELKLGLRRSYELLRDLGDPLGKRFLEEYQDHERPLRRALDRRNRSVLAHGTTPVAPAVYQDLKQWVEKRLREIFGRRFKHKLERHRFPMLTVELFMNAP